ncbi:serine/threonine protein kinase [Coemansia sp. RSA 1286]|nr:serine/threonine protein kinase [Coemansia sp. RSA 485]KAJ2602243.1 serine/threonine protein kinase [Coemansia sp. RSA 1721]KAJ2639406.1 serine/threonine protein kinase [Coemansia sp. RSA 1286]
MNVDNAPRYSDSQDIDGLNQIFQDQLLLNQVPHDVWGVLLSLTPEDYETVHLKLSRPANAPINDSDKSAKESSGEAAKFGYYIGRHKTCDIKIQNPHISNRHCLIYRVEGENVFGSHDGSSSGSEHGGVGKVYLEDTSTNGTFVNGQRVGKDASVELRDGDEIQLVRYQPSKGMAYFSDRFYVFQNLAVHRSEPCLFKQSYLLADHLGKGAFAEVRVAINRVTGKRYAAKIIDRKRITQLEKRKKMDENFRIETSILSRVRHDSIVQVHGVFEERDNLYLVLDLACDGELFDEIVAREFLAENDARRVMLQLLLAIRHLNRLGIVHRDIKLENILLEDKTSLRIKLADFGLAKIVGEQMFMKTVCGTPMYVAPEVLTVRQIGRYDNLVDMWSIGVVLYICLCGFPPFSDELSPPPMRDQIIHGIYSFPSPYWDAISEDARELVHRMLQVDPKNRITVDAALAHPWLRARRIGTKWIIDGVEDFSVGDPDALDDSQKTQSLTADSSQHQFSQPWSPTNSIAAAPRFMQSPTVLKPKHVLLSSSPPEAVAVSDSEAALHSHPYSPGEITARIDAANRFNNPQSDRDSGNNTSAGGASTKVNGLSGRKRKDPSFMRSRSDLGQMVSTKRSVHADHFQNHMQQRNHQLQQHVFSRMTSNQSPDSGPLAIFEMSPDMSREQSCSEYNGRHAEVANGHRAMVTPGQFGHPPIYYPKPLPRPGAQQQQQEQQEQQEQSEFVRRHQMNIVKPVASRGCSFEVGAVSEDASMSRQSSVLRQQPQEQQQQSPQQQQQQHRLPAFFGFGNRRL